MEKSILDTVIETAKGLDLDKVTIKELEALKIKNVKRLTPNQIKSIRSKSKLSQSAMAKILNVGPTTIQKWERGDVEPKGAALKLLNIAYQKGVDSLIA
ncbi:MAG: helix-turn-helix domain-containing protein [Bdellovibrionales bacterium]|nr:helix-turn-helix domain-containing protein [Bdellovibrionales bacterium]